MFAKITKTKKIVLIVGIAIILCTVPTAATIYILQQGPIKPAEIPLGDYSYTKEYSDFRINKLMKEYHVPGVAISLMDEDEIIMEKYYGYANVEERIPFSNNTSFKIGSISKLFTAIEIMRLANENLIDIDQPISTYLPEFNISYRFESSPITVRHLLSHRSGLPRNDILLEWHWDTQMDCLKTQMESLNGTYAAYPAGVRFKYSNVAYNILGHLIEKVRGIPFVFHMMGNFFEKVGMDETTYLTYFVSDKSSIARGYYREGNVNKPYNDYDIISLASGGAISRMGDLQNFYRFLLQKGMFNNESILSSDTLESMYIPQFLNDEDPQGVGLGFFINEEYLGKKVVFHAGTNMGRKTIFAFVPETNQGVILMGNQDNFEDISKEFTFELLEIMLETKLGKLNSSTIVNEISYDGINVSQFTGQYLVDGDIMTVYEGSRGLKVSYKGFNIKLQPIKENSFIVKSIFSQFDGYVISFNQENIQLGDFDMLMIISMHSVHHIYCPRISNLKFNETFDSLIGDYSLSSRIHSSYSESDDMGKTTIEKIGNNLFLPIFNAIIFPISESELILLGGEWDGETMFYDSETQTLVFQNLIFNPD